MTPCAIDPPDDGVVGVGDQDVAVAIDRDILRAVERSRGWPARRRRAYAAVPVPAIVVITPCRSMRRTRWLKVSATSRRPPSSKASACGAKSARLRRRAAVAAEAAVAGAGDDRQLRPVSFRI